MLFIGFFVLLVFRSHRPVVRLATQAVTSDPGARTAVAASLLGHHVHKIGHNILVDVRPASVNVDDDMLDRARDAWVDVSDEVCVFGSHDWIILVKTDDQGTFSHKVGKLGEGEDVWLLEA